MKKMDVTEAWNTIMKIAEEHALIVQSYGGVATLAMPDEQENAGIRQICLTMAGKMKADRTSPQI